MQRDKCQAFFDCKPLMQRHCIQESSWLGQIATAAPPGQQRPLGRRRGCQGNWDLHADVIEARLGEYDRADP